jgi:ABC-type branched-subunit amino acid transport system ATPase component
MSSAVNQRPGTRIVATGLVKRFGGFTAVDHVNLTIGGPAVTALIGPNGAGKSTLFNLISGQIRPDEGRVLIDGVDVTSSRPHKIAHLGVARGFQDVRLFPSMTVLDNVRVYAQSPSTARLAYTVFVPNRSATESRRSRERARELLAYLSISHLEDVYCSRLSFAQQKLVALARLLALEPQVLMLDEPASGLDHHGRDTLTSAIQKVAADGQTVCFVEHNTEMVREIADRVVFLAQGQVLADDTPEAVFQRADLAEAYLGLA